MSTDKELKQAVLDELNWEPSVNAAHIGVSAKDGIISLMGHVETFAEKSAAERAARRVSDVKAVAEEIDVRLPFTVKHGDEEIAAAAVNRLLWDASVPNGAVTVRVEKGHVTLAGEVEWYYQAQAAVSDIRGMWGVVGVKNEIKISPKPNATAIRDQIMVALDRAWFDPAKISVTAEAGHVKLTGKVNSWHEREEAGDAAWAAPGTTSVKNDLHIV